MAELPVLSLSVLKAAMSGGGAALRVITRLQPAGGAGDKVFPPTYAVDGKATTKYAMETRRLDGQDVATVLLDSVASQANRMEEALFAAWEAGKLNFPVIAVDFRAEPGLADLDRITTLHAPHRIADALLRDAVADDGTLFRDTLPGQAYTQASARNAAAIYAYCPTALIFGVWDSTGPRGGLGNKIQRALVSEIVGFGAVGGVKTASRIDPAGIQANVNVFHDKDQRDAWTIDEDKGLREKGKLVPFNRKGAEGKGKPSAINHSNVAPSIEKTAGGVSLDHATQTTVLSLTALRRLRFPVDAAGQPLPDPIRAEAELAARTALAALGMAAVVFLREDGFHLRSRALLVPEVGEPLTVELVSALGGEGVRYRVDPAQAAALVQDAAREAAALGLPWVREPLKLRPAPKLAALIRKSREVAASGEGEDSSV